LRGNARRELVRDMVENRGQYATFITILAAGTVLCASSVLILQVEGRSSDANIVTGGDALWWGFVTITTVGYGDFYPVTSLGRMIGVLVMFSGVGIIGALASILASLLVPPPKTEETQETAPSAGPNPGTEAILGELAELRTEVASLRTALAVPRQDGPNPTFPPGPVQ
jgi:voltage-gated potassium channel